MKKILFVAIICISISNSVNADVINSAISTGGLIFQGFTTKALIDNSRAYTRNLDAQTEMIKNGKNNIEIIPQPDGTAKVYQNGIEIMPSGNPTADKMGLAIANNIARHIEKNNAKEKIKEIKKVAIIENDKETLEIIKKYKKAGAIVTLQKIEEFQQTK